MNIEIELMPSLDGEDVRSSEFQESAKLFENHASRGAKVNAQVRVQKSEMRPAMLSGRFILEAIRSPSPIFIAIVGFYAGKQNRTVKIRVNGVEIDAGSIEEVERLFQALAEVSNDN